ncbi:MAG: hypothetical protein WBL86_22690 [Pseudolabrys sp.]
MPTRWLTITAPIRQRPAIADALAPERRDIFLQRVDAMLRMRGRDTEQE